MDPSSPLAMRTLQLLLLPDISCANDTKLPLASHGGGPEDLQMLLAMPNAIYMESGSFKGHTSTVETLRMVDSAVLAPEGPGMGSELRPDYIQKHKV
jgi:L-alanine-DL-glutamate epimerase-like enolase superfamily enzyme